ncbi:hypothetical protein BJ912DRAFT_159310 [Pholiota molesta]|nr:hypothetical protein BJ912DRAFT_159310 [Pholiota molesta]
MKIPASVSPENIRIHLDDLVLEMLRTCLERKRADQAMVSGETREISPKASTRLSTSDSSSSRDPESIISLGWAPSAPSGSAVGELEFVASWLHHATANQSSERPQIPNRIVPVTSRPSCQASNWNPRSNVYLYSFNVNIFYTFVSTLTITLALSFLSTVTTV